MNLTEFLPPFEIPPLIIRSVAVIIGALNNDLPIGLFDA